MAAHVQDLSKVLVALQVEPEAAEEEAKAGVLEPSGHQYLPILVCTCS